MDLPGRLIMIVSSSSFFVNSLEQAQSAAFSGRSSGFFFGLKNPTAVKAPGADFSQGPATCASPEISVASALSVMAVTPPPVSIGPDVRNTPRPASRN